MKTEDPYSALAPIYDHVMRHVDYRDWASYIAGLITTYKPELDSILELACGTGTLASELIKYVEADYHGLDISPAMIREAQRKLPGIPRLSFGVDDFINLQSDRMADVVLLLYDGLNYLTEIGDLVILFKTAAEHLNEGGIFIFDHSTPANSIINSDYFEDSGKGDDFSFYRTSKYDSEQKLHTTTFEIGFENGLFFEEHLQRAYKASEIMPIVDEVDLTYVDMFENFTNRPPDEKSERIHWIVQKTN